MPGASRNARPRYITTIQQVQEVILAGAASMSFWTDWLAREGLAPYAAADGAAMLLSATSLSWMGMRFHEFTVAVAVAERDDRRTQAGYYLAHALNSSPLLAWAERTLFATPYQRGVVALDPHAPASITVGPEREPALVARQTPTAACAWRGEQTSEWPIYLPSGGARRGRLFFARLSGLTEVYPFVPDQDTLELRPQPDSLPHWLSAAHFRPHEWRLRRAAVHARSQTYRRTGSAPPMAL